MPALIFGMVVILADRASGQATASNPESLRQINVQEHLGDTIPLDLEFTNHRGEQMTLDQYFHGEKPVLMTLVYYDCPMLCTLVLNGLRDAVDSLSWIPGEDYQLVTVSIDPRETADLAKAKREVYVNSLNTQVRADGWAFLVGEESQSRRLADALGFRYYYDEKKDIYAHPAVSYILTESGKITRYLYGIKVRKQNLRLALLEGARGKVGSAVDRVLLYCYQYNPDEEGYVLMAGNVMKLGGGLTVLVLGTVLGIFWWRERKGARIYRTHTTEGQNGRQ